jgi:hypothetical protein
MVPIVVPPAEKFGFGDEVNVVAVRLDLDIITIQFFHILCHI